MKTTEEAVAFAGWLKEGLIKGDGSDKFSGEYQQGYYNGIEILIAYIEERPQLFRGMDKKPMRTDMDKFPEYFL